MHLWVDRKCEDVGCIGIRSVAIEFGEVQVRARTNDHVWSEVVPGCSDEVCGGDLRCWIEYEPVVDVGSVFIGLSAEQIKLSGICCKYCWHQARAHRFGLPQALLESVEGARACRIDIDSQMGGIQWAQVLDLSVSEGMAVGVDLEADPRKRLT